MRAKKHKFHIKSYLLLYSLYYAKACNKFAEHVSASLRPSNTAPFEEMSRQWWRAVENAVSDLIGPGCEPQTSHSRDERATAGPTVTMTTLRTYLKQ